MVDSAHELQQRLDLFGQEDAAEGGCSESTDPLIIRELTNMLNQHNHLVEQFRFVRGRLQYLGLQILPSDFLVTKVDHMGPVFLDSIVGD
jgi:hypothetical protein